MPTCQLPQALMVPDKLEEMHIWIELAMTVKSEYHQSIGQGNTVYVAVEGDEVEVGRTRNEQGYHLGKWRGHTL